MSGLSSGGPLATSLRTASTPTSSACGAVRSQPNAAERMFRDLETTRGEPEQTERAAWFNGPLPIPDTARAEGH